MTPVSKTPSEKSAAPASAPLPKLSPAKTARGASLTRAGRFVLLILCLIAFASTVYFFGIAPRLATQTVLDHEQKLSAQRIVVYALVRSAAPKIDLPLPGTIEPFQQASIYARTNGYVKRWLTDIGDQVHEGDLLAELDTPEIDQQLIQSKATAAQARASLAIAQAAADRWDSMVAAHAVSKEEADEKDAIRDEAKATLDADTADIARLTDLENFKEIHAPFSGKITLRNIEVGNLVSSGNGTGTVELYRVDQTDPLRVFVDVPEASTGSIKAGVKAELRVPAYPGRVFEGEVVRSAGAIDNASRTLRTEIDVRNPDGALLPGTFADVHLALAEGAPAILIPANTLIVNSAGTQVALLESMSDPDQFKVHLLPVRVGRDFGTEVEILQDLKEGDRLVTNPPADLGEGMVVTGKMLKPPVSATAPPSQKS